MRSQGIDLGLLDFLFGAKAPALPSLHQGRGWTIDVVGESNYQSAIGVYYRRNGGKGSDLKCRAELVPDDRNVYDSNAIQVKIAGLAIGYLPRDLAKDYRSIVASVPALSGSVSCSAKITGGHKLENGEIAHFGVKLNISWPPRVSDHTPRL